MSARLTVDDASAEPVQLRIGVYPIVDKKTDIARRFENAKSAVSVSETVPVGF